MQIQQTDPNIARKFVFNVKIELANQIIMLL